MTARRAGVSLPLDDATLWNQWARESANLRIMESSGEHGHSALAAQYAIVRTLARFIQHDHEDLTT